MNNQYLKTVSDICTKKDEMEAKLRLVRIPTVQGELGMVLNVARARDVGFEGRSSDKGERLCVSGSPDGMGRLLIYGSPSPTEMSTGAKSQEAAEGSHMVFLAAQIQELCNFLQVLSQEQPYELDSYSRKLNDSSKRVTSTCRILENVHARLIGLQREISREVYVKKESPTNMSSTFSSH
ncbi:unnamed protein product [Angiostrongylus costaricensis]|uniref:Mediator of RNA polymerase II transcription subunit 11 n=1 Tax=Angiostrongylus costaricensis TaxID=334426 RepID=A0A158PEM5_ANGCS|nr:unnamed protein product [Angiostrongylus costaricensis]